MTSVPAIGAIELSAGGNRMRVQSETEIGTRTTQRRKNSRSRTNGERSLASDNMFFLWRNDTAESPQPTVSSPKTRNNALLRSEDE